MLERAVAEAFNEQLHLLRQRCREQGLPVDRAPVAKTAFDDGRYLLHVNVSNRLPLHHGSRRERGGCCIDRLKPGSSPRGPSPSALVTPVRPPPRERCPQSLLGSVGDPYGNAVAESSWERLRIELVNRRR
ncbi:hypothetical protein [Kineococcus sp. SYSU DK005]|uniref:hypothetical protein n=1 Tax=Kineococcus sp. SYSU DK005 TaxID=3383126 RepID=UPI003D7DB9F7